MNDAFGMPQTVLVLGGGSEIARALVVRLVAVRAETVVLAGRRGSAALDQTAEAVRRSAAAVDLLDFDAADPASAAGVVDEAWARHPDIDLVVVAFGVLGDQVACENAPAEAAAVATVNYTATVVAGLAVARHLRKQGHGTLVALSSVAGERVRRANFVYGSTKAGMDGFMQGLGDSLAGSGARVMIVRPGFVHTRMTAGMDAAPFATDAPSVANDIMKGLTNGTPIVWSPTVLRPVFAVFRHLPRRVWRRLPG